jgi:hypothetical protein
MTNQTIVLKTDCPYLREEQFSVEPYMDELALFFNFDEEVMKNESSVGYLAMTKDMLRVPTIKIGDIEGKRRRQLLLRDGSFLLVEIGAHGSDFEYRVLTCVISLTDTQWTATFTDAPNSNDVQTAFDRVGYRMTDICRERLIKKVDALHNDTSVKALLDAYASTDFLRLSGRLLKISVRLEEDGEFYLTDPQITRKDKVAISSKGEISLRTGDYLCQQNHKMEYCFSLLKVEKFAHDYEGTFYAVTERVCDYPEDYERIRAEFWDMLEDECMAQQRQSYNGTSYWPDAIEIAYLNPAYKLGDKTLYLPVNREIVTLCVPHGIFQFIADSTKTGFYGPNTTMDGKLLLRLSDNTLYGTVVESRGQLNVLFYKHTRVVRYNGVEYAEFQFKETAGFANSSNFDSSLGTHSWSKQIWNHVQYLLYSGQASPVRLESEVWAQLEKESADARRDECLSQ